MLSVVAKPVLASIELALERAACPLCGSEECQPTLSAHDPSMPLSADRFQVVRCPGCRLHYTNPRPTPASIGHFYAVDYRPHMGKAHYDRPLRGWYPRDWLLPPAVGKVRPRLLDFGCGAGHFLAGMQRLGWEAVGIDMSETAVTAVRETIGVAAFVGSLPHDELESASFDLVTMWHALEHVHDPLGILRQAHNLLIPQGRLIVAVPDFAGWPRRWFGSAWYGLDLPRHLTHFTPDTLVQMLDRAGFRVLGMRHPRHADWLRSSALLARKHGRRSLGQKFLQFRLAARLTASLCQLAGKSDVILVQAERS